MRPTGHDLKVTFVTNLFQSIDPRRSLVAGTIWLVIALTASFAIAASLWVGRVAREIVVQQHVRRLALETDQYASDVAQAVSARLDALRALGRSAPASLLFARLTDAYPDVDWIAFADGDGHVVAAREALPGAGRVSTSSWFTQGLKGPWIGSIEGFEPDAHAPLLGDFSAPVHDAKGRIVGVVASHLNWRWAANDVRRLSQTLDARGSAQTLLLDSAGAVIVGPEEMRNKTWNGVPAGDSPPSRIPRFERLPDGRRGLVARAPIDIGGGQPAPGWQVQLSEPEQQVYERADALAIRILWISICLGALTALLGALGARHLTNRLKRLTRSAAAVGRNETARIEVPGGRDEVAQLGAAFGKILDDLREERSELRTLSTELERRVAVRTREVERLAEESRYAAIVRERLKIARDLHDTLAHSMMAMLSEVRLLRKLQAHDPAALPEELARAEEVAHAGLNEARTAITQMRVNAVRDTGLGPALAKAFTRFLDHTGLTGEFITAPEAAGFGDERAETIFRMAEEALRNIERHAMAARVVVSLRMLGGAHLQLIIEDDGVGFDTRLSRPEHYGLVGIKEQAQLIGAQLNIRSGPNIGTTLEVTLRVVPEML